MSTTAALGVEAGVDEELTQGSWPWDVGVFDGCFARHSRGAAPGGLEIAELADSKPATTQVLLRIASADEGA